MPGIGKATASAIVTFAFNVPSVFIETNIRRVFIHFFFQGREAVSDGELIPLVERAMDRKDPREWYYALMDYGAMLKKTEHNPNIRSLHYRKQTQFKGSDRQLRGQFLRALLNNPDITLAAFLKKTGNDPVRTKKIIAKLQDEGFIQKKGSRFLFP
jgi:A/G-specific adenine glycosylase